MDPRPTPHLNSGNYWSGELMVKDLLVSPELMASVVGPLMRTTDGLTNKSLTKKTLNKTSGFWTTDEKMNYR